MYGKLLTHLREQRMKQSSFFNFSKVKFMVIESYTIAYAICRENVMKKSSFFKSPNHFPQKLIEKVVFFNFSKLH
jgi:hypothetical protein